MAKACTAAGISTDVSLATCSASFKLLTAVSDSGCLRSRARLIALLPRQWSKLPTHLRISNSEKQQETKHIAGIQFKLKQQKRISTGTVKLTFFKL